MRAVRLHRLGGPEVLEVEEAPDPVPGPRELLVRVEATSINRRDLWMRAGHPHPAYHVPLPAILGIDLSGHVVTTGEEVEDSWVGQRITINPYITCGRCEYCRRERSQYCTAFAPAVLTAAAGDVRVDRDPLTHPGVLDRVTRGHDMPAQVDPEDRGQRHVISRMGMPSPHPQVPAVDRGRLDAHEQLARAGYGVRDLFDLEDLGTSEPMQADRLQLRSAVTSISIISCGRARPVTPMIVWGGSALSPVTSAIARAITSNSVGATV